MPRIAAIIAVLPFGLLGCGTIANMRGETVIYLGPKPFAAPTKPFGGVAQDVTAVNGIPGGILLLGDVPFSLVGDLLTLPWATYTCMRATRQPQDVEVASPVADTGK